LPFYGEADLSFTELYKAEDFTNLDLREGDFEEFEGDNLA